MAKKQKRPNRHRMSDFTARKIGLVPNKSMRYDLNQTQKKKVHGNENGKTYKKVVL